MELKRKAAKLRATKDQLFSHIKTLRPKVKDLSDKVITHKFELITSNEALEAIIGYVVAELALSDCEHLIFEQEMRNEE